MSKEQQIIEVVAFFRNAFSLLFALALAEAFKQFVTDRPTATDPVVRWEKLITLLSFLLLIVPFYQGTVRYFVFTYGDPAALLRQPNYSLFIMFDCGAFLFEAALFFIMSRALAPAHWAAYYLAVVVLLLVDTVWAFTAVAWLHQTPIQPWMFLNLGFGIVVGAMLLWRAMFIPSAAVAIGFVAVLIRTLLDYYLTWDFYFPK